MSGTGRDRKIFRPRALEIFAAKHPSTAWQKDIFAGATVGLIALPLSLALGMASVPPGTSTPLPPPAAGLVTAVIAGFLVALLGGSRVQVAGPTAAFVPIILLVVLEHGYSGLLVATMMAGILLICMGLARMGALIKYIPWPVTSGFTTGIAVSIILTQAPELLGISTVGDGMPREFIEKWPWLVQHVHAINPASALLALACAALIFLWPRFKISAVPGSIVAVVVATAAVAAGGWGADGTIATIGSQFGSNAIPAGLPAPHFPEINWSQLRELVGPALAIALLGAIESLLSAVVADGMSGDRHDSNTELVAQGVANVVCPLFGGLPATGAIARTSANVRSGAQTPVAGMMHSATLLAVMLLAAPLAVHIPMPAMSAVLLVVAVRMGEWHELTRLHRMPRSDALVLLATCGLTVVFDLVVAVEAGMVLAAVLFIKRVSETTEVSRVTEDDQLERPEQLATGKPIPEGTLVYRIFGPFLFGAAEKMEDAILQQAALPRVLILRVHLVTAMDATGLSALQSVVERMQAQGGTTILSGIHRQPLELIRRTGFLERIGRGNLCATFDDSLARARVLLSETGQKGGGGA